MRIFIFLPTLLAYLYIPPCNLHLGINVCRIYSGFFTSIPNQFYIL